MRRDILVDGYNIIKNGHSFQSVRGNLAVGRNLLVTQLLNRYRHTPYQVIVVFDGDSTSEQTSAEQRIRIIFSRRGETADSVIVRLASEARTAGREVEMYSDDGEVRQAVSTQGGAVHSTGQLVSQLNAAPRDVARRSRHRQAMRRKYGLDPKFDPDDEPEPPSKKHKRSSRH